MFRKGKEKLRNIYGNLSWTPHKQTQNIFNLDKWQKKMTVERNWIYNYAWYSYYVNMYLMYVLFSVRLFVEFLNWKSKNSDNLPTTPQHVLLWNVTKVCICYISAKSFQLVTNLDITSFSLLHIELDKQFSFPDSFTVCEKYVIWDST